MTFCIFHAFRFISHSPYQNHSTQLPAAPKNGSRDHDGGENTHELFSGKTTRHMIMEFCDQDDDEPNFPWVADTMEEYFGLPVKPKSTVEAIAWKGKVSMKPGSSTVAQQQQNHSTQLLAAPKNGSRETTTAERILTSFSVEKPLPR